MRAVQVCMVIVADRLYHVRNPPSNVRCKHRSVLHRQMVFSSHCLGHSREAKLHCRSCWNPSHQQPLLKEISYSLWRVTT